MLLTALLFAALALVRNAWGLVVVSACLLGVWTVLVAGEPVAATALVVALGVFLAVGSLRAAFDVVRSHLKAPPASRMLSAPRRRWGCQSRGHWVSSCSSSVRASRPRWFWSAARLSGDLAQAMTRRPSRMSSRSWESMYHCGLAFLVDPV